MGDNVGDDVEDDLGNGDNGGNNASNDASEGDGGDTSRKGEGLLGEDTPVAAAAAVRPRRLRQRRLHIAGVISFLL